MGMRKALYTPNSLSKPSVPLWRALPKVIAVTSLGALLVHENDSLIVVHLSDLDISRTEDVVVSHAPSRENM